MAAPLSPMARLRYDVIVRTLEAVDDATSFLEVGCGEGALATLLAERYEYVGYEPDEAAFRAAAARLAGHPRARVVNDVLPEMPQRTFDLLGAFEVLEHLEDDVAALAAWVRWVRPGGMVAVSVPAHQHRFGAADEAVGHFRRYSRAGIAGLLAGAGLVGVEVNAYGFPLGYALEWVRNRILARRSEPTAGCADRTAASGRTLQPGERLAGPIAFATKPFVYLQRPFATTDRGTGWVATARRPG